MQKPIEKSQPFVSVIIPTFNRGDFLTITIESFLNQDYPEDSFEIIVVNNNSTDNTGNIIDECCKNHFNIRSLYESRQGVHYARNSAAKIAKGDILYYTDDDMIADQHLLSEIVKVFNYDQNIGTATGKIIGHFESEPPNWVKNHLINMYLSLTEKTRKEDLIITSEDLVYSCHQAIKRDVFFKAGGFNPENTAGVWIGDGETGLNIKIRNNGYKFAYTSKSIIYHIIPNDRTTLAYIIRRLGNQGYCDAYTEYRKHRNVNNIIQLMIWRNTIEFTKKMLISLCKVLTGRLSWHFIPAQLNYFYRRSVYDIKIFRDAEYRKMVEIDDWIES